MTAARRTLTARGPLSVLLIVLATALGLAGGVALYLRQQIVDPESFADRAVDALADDDVRKVVSRELVVQVIDRGSSDLISARPVLETVVTVVVGSEPFRRVFRIAAVQANKTLFAREGGNAAFDIGDAGTLIISGLRSISPDLARAVPPELDARLVELRKREFATQTLRFADNVRLLGILLPLLAVALLVAGVAVAPDRRVAVTRAGIAIGVAGAGLAVLLLITQGWVGANVEGEDELTDAEVKAAVLGIWNAFLGDLTLWSLGVGALALFVAAASASLVRPMTAGDVLERVRPWLLSPRSRRWRVVHGAVTIALGIFVVLEPLLALTIVAIAAGALLVYAGTAELVAVFFGARRRRAAGGRAVPAVSPRTLFIGGSTAVAALVAAIVVVSLVRGGEGVPAAADVKTCNGYAELCDKRLDQVVFAGTHNSMSAADSRGWLLANQRRTIERQLRDGIRLFLIDPHYGVRDRRGKVRTDFNGERRGLNRVSKALSAQALAAVERLGGRLGLGDLRGGRREVWLCHSVCELGATRMVDAMETIGRFLKRNPGEVVILFSEDYVSERDLDRVYREAGVHDQLVSLDRTQPLPTLRQLVRANTRLIVFSERVPSGQYEWNHDGFAWVQDTPLGAQRPGQLRCDRFRGDDSSPLLMLNHWIDKFPPPLSQSRAVLREAFVRDRSDRCARVRAQTPNMIATDFYDQGKLIESVRALNGLEGKPPAPVR